MIMASSGQQPQGRGLLKEIKKSQEGLLLKVASLEGESDAGNHGRW